MDHECSKTAEGTIAEHNNTYRVDLVGPPVIDLICIPVPNLFVFGVCFFYVWVLNMVLRVVF